MKSLPRAPRRNVLKLLGGAIATTQIATPQQCAVVASPALTEGPYFVDEELNRADIRTDPTTGIASPGLPLSLAIKISQLKDCGLTPLTGAYVDIWHCDAAGVYSDVGTAVGRKFLRGFQATDRAGMVYFLTVYPGWYQGRAVHIHAKIRIFNGYDQTYEFTSQFFFDESFTDEIYQLPLYATKGKRDTLNSTDGIYNGASSLGTTITSGSGNRLMLNLRRRTSWVEADASLIVDLSLGSSPDQVPGGGPGGPGGPPPPR